MAFSPTVSWSGGVSSASGFNSTPAGSADPRQGDDRIRELKIALAERLSREFFFALVGSSSAGQEGNLRAGAGRIYHTSSAPTTKPDGNALDADDVGRMYAKSNTTPLTVRTSNSTWVAVKAGSATLSSKANYVVETGGSVNMKMKVIEIGDWNMDTTASVSVAHGLTSSKIRSAEATIRSDGDAIGTFPLARIVSVGGVATDGGGLIWDPTTVYVNRVTGGFFDSSLFDATSFNRGWITIWYTE